MIAREVFPKNPKVREPRAVERSYMFFVFLAVLVILTVLVILQYVKSFKIKRECVILFTGTMGSGKSLLGVRQTLANRNYQDLKRMLSNAAVILNPGRVFANLFRKKKNRKPLHKINRAKPLVFSNIPIRSKYYRPLTSEMLLKKEALPENCCIFCDEFGSTIASQYDWEDVVVREELTAFFRYCRHWLNALIVITDQTSSSIPKMVRERVSGEYHLSKFRKWAYFFYKIDVYPVLHITDDTTNTIDTTEPESVPYLFGFLGKPKYNSRCFVETYQKGFVYSAEENEVEDPLNSRLLLDATGTPDQIQAFKRDKKAAKQEIYSRTLSLGEKK